MNSIIYMPDQLGYVKLIDYMGSDTSIYQAAKVSYNGEDEEPPLDKVEALLDYLMRHKHTSPFEMAEIQFLLHLPIFVARQLIRHRTANVNEVSGRYVTLSDEFWCPSNSSFRAQSITNKQGGDKSIPADIGGHLSVVIEHSVKESYRQYLSLQGKGLCKEQARSVLPVATYTTMMFKIDLHNLMHLLELRMDKHAQAETRDFANAMYSLVEPLFPLTFKAFTNHRLEGMTLSGDDIFLIREQIRAIKTGNMSSEDTSRSERIADKYKKGTNKIEIHAKLARLGL